MLMKLTNGTITRRFWVFSNGTAQDLDTKENVADIAALYIELCENGYRKV